MSVAAALSVAATFAWLVTRAAQKPSVVLVSLGAIRADVLDSWAQRTPLAGRGALAPTLAHLCARGICFSRAYSNAPYARAAAATALTGTLSAVHGVRAPLDRLSPTVPQLAELFAASGYDTGAVAGSYEVDEVFGFRGFDRFDRRFFAPIVDSAEDPLPIPSLVFHDWGFALSARLSKLTADARKPDRLTTDAALGFLAMHHRRPFFLWVHYFGASPLGSLEGQVTVSADKYAERVRSLDQELARLLKGLVEMELDRRVWLFVYGDAGFALFEHGESGVAASLYEPSVRVPLIVVPPRDRVDALGGRQVDAPVSLLDLAPTIARVAALPVRVQWPSEGFSRLLLRQEEHASLERTIPLENYARGAVPGAGDGTIGSAGARAVERMRALRKGAWKYMLTEQYSPFALLALSPERAASGSSAQKEELYDLNADPAEQNNLAPARPELCAELRALLPSVETVRVP